MLDTAAADWLETTNFNPGRAGRNERCTTPMPFIKTAAVLPRSETGTDISAAGIAIA
jgi:hypothetical protein